ncbi:MAG: hypothetical protein P1V97_25600 [Planctomycetota bacterium]|nr:hypothetical protein [Planctomycetota bacterium]
MAVWIDKDGREHFRFDKNDLVRLNTAAHKLDFLDPEQLFQSIEACHQSSFVAMIFRYGSKYNRGEHWQETLSQARVIPGEQPYDSLLLISKDLAECGDGQEIMRYSGEIASLFDRLDFDPQRRLIKLGIAYFIFNEHERYQLCKGSWECNHWWHKMPDSVNSKKRGTPLLNLIKKWLR